MDPLKANSPRSAQVLFEQFSKAAHGFSTEDAVGAAANILLNALRQSCDSRQKAEAQFDALFGKLKQCLVDHYDGAGKRRSIFPFNQIIEVPHLINKPGIGLVPNEHKKNGA